MKKYLVPIVSVVALVVGLLALLRVASIPAPQPQQPAPLGGAVLNGDNQFTNGISFGDLPVNVNWTGGKIAAKSNTAFWKNSFGRTIYVDYVEVSTDATASSTFKIYAYASSSAPRLIYDFTAPTAASSTFINAFALATSSYSTTTTNIDSAVAGKTIQVPDGWYVNILLRANGTTCPSTGGSCESATSTNRGFNMPWRIRYHN